VGVQCFPPCRVGVFNVDIHRAVERSQPRCEWFRVEVDRRRQLSGPWRRGRIDDERSQMPVLVDQIQVRVVMRDQPSDIRRDDRAQRRKITLGDDGVRHLEQRPPVVALHVKPAFPCHVGSIVTRTY
jgi:hypothetical protein